MPWPMKGESKSHYLNRAIPAIMADTGKEQEAAAAQAYGMWKAKKPAKKKTEAVAMAGWLNASKRNVLYIYKNPTLKEIKNNIVNGSRGWISDAGDFYTEGYEDTKEITKSSITHSGFLSLLSKELSEINFHKAPIGEGPGIATQRFGLTSRIFIGESVSTNILSKRQEEVHKIIQKCQKLNPHFIFYENKINDGSETEFIDNSIYNNWGKMSFLSLPLNEARNKYCLSESLFAAGKATLDLYGHFPEKFIMYLYKNPSLQEFQKNVAAGARGYLDSKGNVYFEGYDDEQANVSRVMHGGILHLIQQTDPKIISDIDEAWSKVSSKGISIQRNGETNEIYIGESIKVIPEMENIIMKLFTKGEKVNPDLQFRPLPILTATTDTKREYRADFLANDVIKRDFTEQISSQYWKNGGPSRDQNTRNSFYDINQKNAGLELQKGFDLNKTYPGPLKEERSVGRVSFIFPNTLIGYSNIHSNTQFQGILNSFGRGVILSDNTVRVGLAGSSHTALSQGMQSIGRFYWGYKAGSGTNSGTVYIVTKNSVEDQVIKQRETLQLILSQIFNLLRLNIAPGGLKLTESKKSIEENIEEFFTFLQEDIGGGSGIVGTSGDFAAHAPEHMIGKPITLRTHSNTNEMGLARAIRGKIQDDSFDNAYKRTQSQNYIRETTDSRIQEKKNKFEKLKKNKVSLTPEEHAEVMKKKAVWHNYFGTVKNRKTKTVSAIWKSKDPETGEITYVTNTHRAYATRPTLKGAISIYHSFIKGTA